MKRLSITSSLAVVVAATFLMFASAAQAVIVPVGLNPGDTYHLVFVTSGGRDATSSDIDDYNDFVQAQAALSPAITGTDLGVQYFAIASTETVDAIDNAPISGPVYLTDGTTLVATGSADMWDGFLLSTLNKTQYGGIHTENHVWTGTLSNGLKGGAGNPGIFYLGSTSPPVVGAGINTHTTSLWTAGTFFSPDNILPFYAISEPLSVPVSAVPEPTTLSLGIFAAGGLIGILWRRRRKA